MNKTIFQKYYGSFLPNPTQNQSLIGFQYIRPYQTGSQPDQSILMQQYSDVNNPATLMFPAKMDFNISKAYICSKLCSFASLINPTCNWRDKLIQNLGSLNMEFVKFLNISSFVNIKGFIARDRSRNLYVVFEGMYDWKKAYQDQSPSLWDSETTWPLTLREGKQFPNNRERDDCRVSSRYLRAWESVREVIKYTMSHTHPIYDSKLILCGHGLGAPLVYLAGIDFALNLPLTSAESYTFGCPRFCNQYFADLYQLKVKNSWRFFLLDDANVYLPIEVSTSDYQHPTKFGLQISENGIFKNQTAQPLSLESIGETCESYENALGKYLKKS